jgi:hypothetical protein
MLGAKKCISNIGDQIEHGGAILINGVMELCCSRKMDIKYWALDSAHWIHHGDEILENWVMN